MLLSRMMRCKTAGVVGGVNLEDGCERRGPMLPPRPLPRYGVCACVLVDPSQRRQTIRWRSRSKDVSKKLRSMPTCRYETGKIEIVSLGTTKEPRKLSHHCQSTSERSALSKHKIPTAAKVSSTTHSSLTQTAKLWQLLGPTREHQGSPFSEPPHFPILCSFIPATPLQQAGAQLQLPMSLPSIAATDRLTRR